MEIQIIQPEPGRKYIQNVKGAVADDGSFSLTWETASQDYRVSVVLEAGDEEESLEQMLARQKPIVYQSDFAPRHVGEILGRYAIFCVYGAAVEDGVLRIAEQREGNRSERLYKKVMIPYRIHYGRAFFSPFRRVRISILGAVGDDLETLAYQVAGEEGSLLYGIDLRRFPPPMDYTVYIPSKGEVRLLLNQEQQKFAKLCQM